MDYAGSERVDELQCSQEIAGTHIFLQARHAGSTSDDTDVLIFLLSHGKELSNCFIKKWKSSKSRNVQLSDVVDNISKKLKRKTLRLSSVDHLLVCVL